MQSDHHAVALFWLSNADIDLRVSKDYTQDLPPVACFHAQQAAEKALKALLTWTAGDSPRSHIADSLIQALEAIGETPPEHVSQAARSLDKYYAPTRYPDALGGADPFKTYSANDAAATLEAAQLVVQWIRDRLEELKDDAS